MDTEIKFNRTCRCCLIEDRRMKNMQHEVFVYNDRKIPLIDGFTACAGIDLNEEREDTCRNICEKCEDKLLFSYEFRELCQSSSQTLRDRADIKQETVSDTDDDEKEVIYTDYLPYETSKPAPIILKISKSRDGKKRMTVTRTIEDIKAEDAAFRPIVELKEGVEAIKMGADELPVIEQSAKPHNIKVEKGLEHDHKSNESPTFDDTEDFAGQALDSDEGDEEPEPFEMPKPEKTNKRIRIKIKVEEPVISSSEVANMEANYMCYHCDQFLPTHNEYIKHRQNHLWNRSPSRIERMCFVCFQPVYGYLKHIEEHHKDFRPNTCKLCDKGKFQKQNALKMHLFSHSNNTLFECLACHQKFKNRNNLRHHVASEKHSKSSYHCPYCGLPFKKFIGLHEHFNLDHQEQNLKKLFPCYKCKKIYMFQKFILDHVCEGQADTKKKGKKSAVKVTGESSEVTPAPTGELETKKKEKAYKCERCSNVFSSKDELVCHQHSVCLEEPSYVCPICKKEFVNQRRLTEHKRTHQNRVFVCDECGHCTTSEPKLLNHKIVHSNERLSKCAECPATFKDGRSLKKHMQIHEERRYECDLCSKKFRNYHNVKQHLATHVKTSALRKFTCDFCDKTFLRGRDRERHLKVHTDERPMKCNLCPKEFRDTGTLNEHYRRTHEGIYYECKYCSKKYTARLKLRDHLFVHRGFKPFNCVECPQQFTKKYLYVKHLLIHNITYVEKIHGYRETENLRDLLAESIRIPNQNTNTIHHHLPNAMDIDSVDGATSLHQQAALQQRDRAVHDQQQQQPTAGCSYALLPPPPHLLHSMGIGQPPVTPQLHHRALNADDKSMLTSILQLQ